jgi:hypothetical protein
MTNIVADALKLRAQCKHHAAKYGEPDHDADLALAQLLGSMSHDEISQYLVAIRLDLPVM